MDFNDLLTKSFIKKLKCSICDNYLSRFPIYLTTTNQNICGRCKVPNEKDVTFTENTVYEAIAENLEFPCCYANQGCVEKLLPKDIKDHEKLCSYRDVKCPASEFNLCQESILYSDLENHCETKHADIVIRNGKFTVDLSKSGRSNHILIQDNDYFIFKKYFDLTSAMFNFEFYCYESEKRGVSDVYSLSLDNQCKVLSLESVFHYRDPDVNDLHIGVLLDCSFGSVIQGKLTIEENSANPTTTPSKGFLDILTCTTCKKYIEPTSDGFFLGKEETMCHTCYKKGYYGSLLKNQRFMKLANHKLIYPCHNQKNGCSYTDKPSPLKNHHLNCPYEDNYCPVKHHSSCKWTGLKKDVTSHVVQDHSTMLAIFSNFYISLENNNSDQTHILKFSKYYFRLNFSKMDNRYCWTIQMLGEFQDMFQYELKIFKDSESRPQFRTIQRCGPAVPEKLLFSNAKEYCYFDADQIEGMLEDNLLKFSINIFKCS